MRNRRCSLLFSRLKPVDDVLVDVDGEHRGSMPPQFGRHDAVLVCHPTEGDPASLRPEVLMNLHKGVCQRTRGMRCLAKVKNDQWSGSMPADEAAEFTQRLTVCRRL